MFFMIQRFLFVCLFFFLFSFFLPYSRHLARPGVARWRAVNNNTTRLGNSLWILEVDLWTMLGLLPFIYTYTIPHNSWHFPSFCIDYTQPCEALVPFTIKWLLPFVSLTMMFPRRQEYTTTVRIIGIDNIFDKYSSYLQSRWCRF